MIDASRNQIDWTALRIALAGLGRFVFPLTIAFSAVYAVGIFMVHAKAGWFVVGAGRNSAEYSVLLIVALLCVGMQHAQASNAKS